jgi:hypothetical protein
MKSLVPYFMLIPGLVVIVIGVAMIYTPAAWIVAGIIVVALPVIDLEVDE